MRISKCLFVLAAIGTLAAQPVRAGVIGQDLGTGNPLATLGSYTMNPYEPGTISGESYTAHEVNGNGTGDGWATWGQSYTGAVHVSMGPNPLTLTLNGTHAIYFYEEPNQFLDFNMTAVDSSGVSVTTLINGYHGSSAVGFYETDPTQTLTSITVTCSDTSGFAIGEFGIDSGTFKGSIGPSAVPEPTTMLLLGAGLGALGMFGRRKARKA
jgi:hypothetical protein